MPKSEIKISDSFSRYPAGRYIKDGPFSGELFRNEFLEPALQGGNKTIIDLDGTRGYGSSFLEEAFGGLVRKQYAPERILDSFEFKSQDESLILEIKDYILHGAGSS